MRKLTVAEMEKIADDLLFTDLVSRVEDPGRSNSQPKWTIEMRTNQYIEAARENIVCALNHLNHLYGTETETVDLGELMERRTRVKARLKKANTIEVRVRHEVSDGNTRYRGKMETHLDADDAHRLVTEHLSCTFWSDWKYWPMSGFWRITVKD